MILSPHAYKGLCPFFRLLGFEFLLIGGAVCYLCSRTGSPPWGHYVTLWRFWSTNHAKISIWMSEEC